MIHEGIHWREPNCLTNLYNQSGKFRRQYNETDRHLFLHLGEFIFIANDEDPVERVLAMENVAIAELAKESWMITSNPALIEPNLTGNVGNIIGY
jgi:hypothetical protein